MRAMSSLSNVDILLKPVDGSLQQRSSNPVDSDFWQADESKEGALQHGQRTRLASLAWSDAADQAGLGDACFDGAVGWLLSKVENA